MSNIRLEHCGWIGRTGNMQLGKRSEHLGLHIMGMRRLWRRQRNTSCWVIWLLIRHSMDSSLLLRSSKCLAFPCWRCRHSSSVLGSMSSYYPGYSSRRHNTSNHGVIATAIDNPWNCAIWTSENQTQRHKCTKVCFENGLQCPVRPARLKEMLSYRVAPVEHKPFTGHWNEQVSKQVTLVRAMI